MKNYNNIIDELIEKAFCDGYEFAQREYSKYDDVDVLRRSKDSDILDEKERERPGYGKAILSGLSGALVGAGTGAAAAGLGGAIKGGKGNRMTGMAKANYKGSAITGAIIGGLTGLTGGLKKRHREQEDIDFYNSRLRYAKHKAKRRERKDWKHNMNEGREEYSY